MFVHIPFLISARTLPKTKILNILSPLEIQVSMLKKEYNNKHVKLIPAPQQVHIMIHRVLPAESLTITVNDKS